MLNPVNSQGVTWWGYAEGDALALAVVTGIFVLFVAVYLFQRLRPVHSSPVSPQSQRRGRRQ